MVPDVPRSQQPPGRRRAVAVAVAAVYAPALAVTVCAAVAHYSGAVPVSHLLRDPSPLLEFPFYTGAVSHVGVVLWWAAATICFFAATLLPRATRQRRFLQAGGLLSAVLGTDDLFVVHDVIFPDYLGIHEAFVVGVYGLMLAAYLLAFASLVARQTAYPYLLAACLLFALSILSERDLVQRVAGLGWAEQLLLEDGLKLLGVSSWLGYFASTARAWVLNPAGDAAAPGERRTEAVTARRG